MIRGRPWRLPPRAPSSHVVPPIRMSVRLRALRAFVAAAVVPCLACGAGTSSDGGVASCPAPNIIGPLGFDNDSIAPQSAQDGWYL